MPRKANVPSLYDRPLLQAGLSRADCVVGRAVGRPSILLERLSRRGGGQSSANRRADLCIVEQFARGPSRRLPAALSRVSRLVFVTLSMGKFPCHKLI